VISYTRKPYSFFLSKKKTERNFTAIKIMLNTDRNILYDRINQRVDRMMEEGLLEEVKNLISFKKFNALKTVGYRELHEYLEEKTDLKGAIEKIKQHTRNYAKRQITWFKNKDQFEVFEPNDFEKIKAYIDIILEND
ncbi:MAG: tRNA (adenosine(37)-N6)-dimethylallyltransferase MiaA, partial [Bacteroidia bacterium]|nr:tRNA (adenosine(37)-N6)-dimethylallyltransferase MiaA [Bacteroidia bacterium]